MNELTKNVDEHNARELSLVDTTSIIVGIIIGAVVFQSAPKIAASLPNLGWLLVAWLAGGVIAWLGALCYAEWGTRCPDGGGDYHYLLRAFGPSVAWVFGWMQLLVIRPGSLGFFALAFGKYAQELFPLTLPHPLLCYAVGALVLSTLVNLCGLREGLLAQRILTLAKVLGLLLVIVVGCLVAVIVEPRPLNFEVVPESEYNPGLAMILILYAYGGWNEVGYLAGEVRHARRTIPRTLGWGLAVVAVLYALLNLAYAVGLGWVPFQLSTSPAAAVLAIPFGAAGETAMHVLLCITLFGALHGSLITGARLTAAFAKDTAAKWQPRPTLNLDVAGHPTWLAYLLEFLISLLALLVVGWEGDPEALIIFASPPFWFGLLMVGWGLLRIRRDPMSDDGAIYRVPCYPWTVLLFMATCMWMTWSSLIYAKDNLTEIAWGVGAILGVGIGLSLFMKRIKS
jgi:APA family basic amino acid/polyamine antiporter